MELDGRRQLMEDAGLKDVVANAYKLDVRADSRGRVQRNGCNGLTRAKVHVIAPVFNRCTDRIIDTRSVLHAF